MKIILFHPFPPRYCSSLESCESRASLESLLVAEGKKEKAMIDGELEWMMIVVECGRLMRIGGIKKD